MSKHRRFISEHSEDIVMSFMLIVTVCLIVLMVFAVLTEKDLTEGMVMNKRHSSGYALFLNDRYHVQPDRWIIEIQNGDKKDWWSVTETYYDSVKIGDWVEK